MSYAAEAQEAFCWNGFGGVCIDAIREVKPIEDRLAEIHIGGSARDRNQVCLSSAKQGV